MWVKKIIQKDNRNKYLIAAKLKELMDINHLTQTELAEKVGLKQKNISDYLNQIAKPSLDALQKLSDYFNVDMGYFLSELPLPFYAAMQFKRYAHYVDSREDFYPTCMDLGKVSTGGLKNIRRVIHDRLEGEKRDPRYKRKAKPSKRPANALSDEDMIKFLMEKEGLDEDVAMDIVLGDESKDFPD